MLLHLSLLYKSRRDPVFHLQDGFESCLWSTTWWWWSNSIRTQEHTGNSVAELCVSSCKEVDATTATSGKLLCFVVAHICNVSSLLQGDEQFQQPQQPVQPPKSNKYSLDVDALINDVELEDDRIQQRAEAVHLAPVRPAGRPQGSPTGRGGGGGGGGANNRISPTNFDAPLGIPPEQRHGSAGLGPSHWQQLKRERDYFMERASGFEERCKQLIRENRELSSRRVHEEESFRQVLMMEKVRYDRLHGKLDVKCQDRDMLLLDWVKLMDAYNVTRNFPFVSEMVARTAMVVPAARPYVPMEYSESISESAGGKRPKTKGR